MNHQHRRRNDIAADRLRPLLVTLVASLLAFAYSRADAATAPCPWDGACLTWTAPTQYTDGSTLQASSIASYKVEAAATAAGPWSLVASVTAPTTAYTRRPVTGTALYRVTTVLVSGVTSGASNAVSDTNVEPPPNAPIVTVAGTGYRMDLGNLNQIKVAGIGIVPIGAPCKADTAMGLNVIDRKLVKLDPGKSLPKQVLANCAPKPSV